MNEFNTIIHLMAVNHISYEELAKRINQTNGGNLYNSINKSKNMYVSSLRKILSALGYEIVVRKKGGTGSEYVITDDETPSPLRFHGMDMSFNGIFNNNPTSPKPKAALTVGERNVLSEELKNHLHELTYSECEKELGKIWGIKYASTDKRQPYNEYKGEYQRYCEEFANLYGKEVLTAPPTPHEDKKVVTKKKNAVQKPKQKKKVELPPPVIPVSGGAHGKIITEDTVSEEDMSEEAVHERAMAKQHQTRDYLLTLVPLKMDD